MARQNIPILSFNTGVMSVEALSRADLDRVRFAAEQMDNLLPNTLGAMKMRPGTKHIGSTDGGSDAAFCVEFVKNAAEKALIELTALKMRVWVSDALVTRAAVSTTIANPNFTTNLASWTDDDESGSTSSHHASGYMQLLGSGTSYARRYQLVTVAGPDQNVAHAIKIVVQRGPVLFKVGTTATNGTYISERTLRTGRYSFSFTPTGDFYITVYAKDPIPKLIDEINIESSGTMEIVTPWTADDLDFIRYSQSGDVIFVACGGGGIRAQRIERYDFQSWGVSDYAPDDGPFRLPLLNGTRLTPSAKRGSITLTSDRVFFDSSHVGALFQMTSTGQSQSVTAAAENVWSDPIRLGPTTSANRTIFVDVVYTGAPGATVRLERSLGVPGAWSFAASYTADSNIDFVDGFPNTIAYYRIGVPTGLYTSGSVTATIEYLGGEQVGIVRVTEFTNKTTVTADVLRALGSTDATEIFREGEFSDFRGHPSANAFYDGRLFWVKNDKIFGSISDVFDGFDPDFIGDGGAINRSVAVGPVDGLYWILPLQRLLVGGVSQEVSIKSSSLDEPITPTQFTAKRCSTRGSANIAAVEVDTSGVFVQRSLKKVYSLDLEPGLADYNSSDLTRLSPDILSAEVVRIAIQRQPETRIWCVLDDGNCAILLYNPQEKVVGWSTFSTDGDVEDVCILPGEEEDDVYFVIKRIINGNTVRYIEKLAKESECVGGTLNYVADCSKVVTSNGSGVFSGLSHLEAEAVTVWGGGAAIRDQSNLITVSGAAFTIGGSPSTQAVIGLPYNGDYKSMKLAFAATDGTALGARKRVDHLGLILNNTGWTGVKIGRDFSNLRKMPSMYRGEALGANDILDSYDFDASSFNGGWSPDSRVCIRVASPYPATVCGMVVRMETNDGHGDKDRN